MSKRVFVAIVLATMRLSAAALTAGQRQSIDKIMGMAGTYTAAEDTHRLLLPRSDAKVTVDGTSLHPFVGLSSSVAFTSAMLTAELALFEDEVNPVMSAALDAGLEVTSLHHHFFFDQPRVMFMQVGGSGSAETLAAGVKKALDTAREIRRVSPEPTRQFSGAPVPPVSSIDPPGINGILRTAGQVNGGMYKATVGRRGTSAAFFGSMDRAFVTGEFVCAPPELQTVLKGLRRRGIQIVSIQNQAHISVHYWSKGRAAEMAVAIRAVADEQAKR